MEAGGAGAGSASQGGEAAEIAAEDMRPAGSSGRSAVGSSSRRRNITCVPHVLDWAAEAAYEGREVAGSGARTGHAEDVWRAAEIPAQQRDGGGSGGDSSRLPGAVEGFLGQQNLPVLTSLRGPFPPEVDVVSRANF